MAYNKETGMYEGFIYKIYNDVNDKVYIGQTKRTVEERWKGHIYDTKNNNDNMVIHKAMNKYGLDKFKYVEIEKIQCETLDELSNNLNDKEKYYISYYNCVRPYGYNISIGGNVLVFNKIPVDRYDLNCNYIDGFDSMVEASLFTGIPVASIEGCISDKTPNKTAYGYVFVRKGDKPYLAKGKVRKVKQYTTNGILLETYNSIKSASEQTGIDSTDIVVCCQRKYKTAGGYIWRYEDDEFTEEELEIFKNNTYLIKHSIYPPVKKYDVFGNYICTYDNPAIASKETGTEQGNIINVCLGKGNSANLYVWRFIYDDFDKYGINYESKLSTIFPIINMYTLDDQFIEKFNTPTAACNFIGKKSISSICNCCNHITKSSYGYKWFWAYDLEQPDKKKIIHKNELYHYMQKRKEEDT